MLLYRYFSDYGLETLRDCQLKVSKVSDFNDPFECMYSLKGDIDPENARLAIEDMLHDPNFLAEYKVKHGLKSTEAARRLFKKNRAAKRNHLVRSSAKLKADAISSREKNIDALLRVACFSAAHAHPRDEILMWSHYADKHRGIRIGFEFPEKESKERPFAIKPINYSDSRVSIDHARTWSNQNVWGEFHESIRTKALSWSYEQEFRLLTSPALTQSLTSKNGNLVDVISFTRDWVKRIDLGTRLDPAVSLAIREELKQNYPNAICNQAHYHETDYALVYKPT